MKLLALTAAVLLLPQEKNEAETLFKKMEEKLAKASTGRVKMTGVLEPAKATVTGEVLLGDGAKLRGDLEVKLHEQTLRASLVCDGKRLRAESTEIKEPKTFDVPEKMGEPVRSTLARGGIWGVMDTFNTETGATAAASDQFTVSKFEMGAKEKVGERETQAVTYLLDKKSHPSSRATVWIDTETHLPVKRTFAIGKGHIVETYSEVTLDEKIDPAKFELPK